jgi:protein-S-isoprenylcysteine O-methyltransferase Ste14
MVAALLAVLGIALEGWAVFVLGWRRACDLGREPPDPALPLLVFAGPFRFVRHPQLLGLLLLTAAAALYWRTPGMTLMTLLAAGVIIALARRDDHACAAHFGEAYARYRRAVPFLIPKLW